MIEISKKNRDIAMRAIIDFFQNKKPFDGAHITPDYLRYHGLPADVDPLQVARVLEGLELIKLEKPRTYDALYITLTPQGCSYFERQSDEQQRTREERRHEWAMAAFSAVAGALLSRPLWAGLSAVWSILIERFAG